MRNNNTNNRGLVCETDIRSGIIIVVGDETEDQAGSII